MGFKAVFLDRDDTIVDDPGYISHPDQVKLLSGAAQALRNMRKLGYKLIVVSNQSAVARGMITEKDLTEIHRRLKRLLADQDVYLDGIYYCPYHPEGVVAEYSKESEFRKPNPGMLLQAAQEMDIDLESSWMIGDSYRDVEAGKKVGCTTILINSPAKPKHKKSSDPNPDFVAVNIKESANIIRMHDSKQRKKRPTEISNPETKPQQHSQTANDHKNADKTNRNNNKMSTSYDTGKVEDFSAVNTNINRSVEKSAKPQAAKVAEDHPTQTRLLKDILKHLKEGAREDQYHDFSVAKLFAGILQVIVVFCLLLSVWLMMDSSKSELSMFKPLGFAAVFQLMCLTFYIMDEIK